jgi:hypothetical protein
MKSSTSAAQMEIQMTVAVPTDLYEEIKRLAASENWPESQVVVMLARLGAKSQRKMEKQLHSSYEAFMRENDPQERDHLGDDMIRSIFGPETVA